MVIVAPLLLAVAVHVSTREAPPVGWMTWYAVKFDASERTILENARAFKDAFGGYTDEKPVLWVDWEWFHRRFNSKGEDGEDAFTPHAASYPRGETVKVAFLLPDGMKVVSASHSHRVDGRLIPGCVEK